MELNLLDLAPLLQCTSINRGALFITAKKKKYYFIKFLSPLLLKKYFFLFLFLSLSPVSLLSSSFFLFQSSILIKPASLLSPLLQSLALTTPHCPAPIADRSPSQRRPLLAAQRRSLMEAQPNVDHSSAPITDRSPAQRRPLLAAQRRSPIEAQPSANHSSLPSADRSPAQCQPLFAFSTSKAESPSSTLSLRGPAPMWVCVYIF